MTDQWHGNLSRQQILDQLKEFQAKYAKCVILIDDLTVELAILRAEAPKRVRVEVVK